MRGAKRSVGARLRLCLVDDYDRLLSPQARVLEPSTIEATVDAEGVASFSLVRITTTPRNSGVNFLRLACVPVELLGEPAPGQHCVAHTEALFLVANLKRTRKKAAANAPEAYPVAPAPTAPPPAPYRVAPAPAAPPAAPYPVSACLPDYSAVPVPADYPAAPTPTVVHKPPAAAV